MERMKSRTELLTDALNVVREIHRVRRRKDVVYKAYRQWCHFSTKEYLEEKDRLMKGYDRYIDWLERRYVGIVSDLFVQTELGKYVQNLSETLTRNV